VSRPVGGVLSTGPLRDTGCVVIHLCGLPGDIDRASRPTFGLAPGGVCRAARVTPGAGALLPHRFTLTCDQSRRTDPSAVCFLWHFPAGHPDWPLTSTVPYGAPTFLDQVRAWPRPPGRLTVSPIVAHVGDGGLDPVGDRTCGPSRGTPIRPCRRTAVRPWAAERGSRSPPCSRHLCNIDLRSPGRGPCPPTPPSYGKRAHRWRPALGHPAQRGQVDWSADEYAYGRTGGGRDDLDPGGDPFFEAGHVTDNADQPAAVP
jgi:hypothetical protein